MERIEIDKKYDQICQDVYQEKLKSALERLSQLLRTVSQADYFYELESLSENYQTLLKYAYEGYNDPKRPEILSGLSASILALADEIKLVLTEKDFFHKKIEKKNLDEEFGEDPQLILEKLDELLSEKELQRILEESGTKGTSSRPIDKVFRLIWLTGKLGEETAARLRKAASSDNLEWHEKCLLVSAITISLLDYFDVRKILLLIDFINARQHQVFQRALTGLVLALIRYDQRIRFYPEIGNRISELSKDEKVQTDLETLILQLLMTQETDKIIKEFEEEVLPEMKKMMPRMEDKLELGTLLEEDDIEGKNPGWKGMIEEVPGLYERIEKFTRMQMEGGDVFMSTFSLLKRFDFFKKMSNWVEPFYADHPELKSTSGEDEQFFTRLLEGLERAFYLCNSDKYSFALNFSAVPSHQRSMLVTYFEAELEQMKEMASEEETLNPSAASNPVFIQYIQDLYRFFKLYPYKNEFQDIFQEKILFSRLNFYKKYFEKQSFTERLAIFYFEKEHYTEAIELYKYISLNHPESGIYYEKIGYSYQKTGNYPMAIQFYRKAELFEGDRLWLLKKLGWCSLKIKDYKQAAAYFEEAASMQPDDLSLQARIAQCYLNLKDFNKAIQHFAKVSFYQPENLKVMRPIAYCYFVMGNLEEAAAYYSRILASGTTIAYDYMNAGHVQLCLNNRKEALNLYKSSFTDIHFNPELFVAAFEEDVPNLIKYKIDKDEIPLIIDYILFNSENIYIE
jgi:tetratricopeptide (TPR) repeat protein